jgi:hypothetical protein
MANLDAPFGFRPVENGVAGTVPRLRKYTVAASTAIYEGDLIGLNASGLVIAYTTTDAAAGDLIGVAAHHVPSGGAGPSSDLSLLVYDDVEQIFEAQADDNSLTQLSDYLFKLVKPVSTTGNTTTLQSKHEIDASSATATSGAAATNIAPLQIVGVSEAINNTANVSFTRYLCRILPAAHLRGAQMGNINTNAAGIG